MLRLGLTWKCPVPAGVNDAKIVAAVKAGTLSEAALDKAVIRILNIVFRAADEAAAPAPELDLKGDHTIAAELAKECAVLLQNRGVLPLKKGSKVVYIGGFAKTPRYQGWRLQPHQHHQGGQRAGNGRKPWPPGELCGGLPR